MPTKLKPVAPPDILTPAKDWKTLLARELLAWYRRHRRDLPWRRTRDPYQIWVSEIMLQQTQVATVVPFFNRFIAAFRTIQDLAAADEHDVLRLWEGLGYYRRARQLHRAARVVVEEHNGKFPRDLEAIGHLPGIGRYTAGAIASIAFDLRAPILEANTRRLFSRLAGYRGDPASNTGQKRLWEFAENVLPQRGCRSFNQAVMELGSLLCTPRAPDCGRCPVSDLCAAFQSGTQIELGQSTARPRTEEVHEASVVIVRGRKVLLRQRPEGERWAGLWDFVRFPLAKRGAAAVRREIAAKVQEHSGLTIDNLRRIATLKHGVTRFRITLDCYLADVAAARPTLTNGTWRWVSPGQLAGFPLSMTGRKLSRLAVDELAAGPR